jgi:hypothetical protein
MKQIAGLLILVFIGFIVYPLLVGDAKMKSFCATIRTGESRSVVVTRAMDAGYSSREIEGQNQILLIDSRAMGRYICDVSLSDDKVTGAKYVPNG